MSEKITELKLLNGESVKIQTTISLYDWKKAKKDGLLTQNAFASAMKNGGGNPNINDKDLENAPFVAYRAAGGSMSKYEFEKAVVFDLQIAGRIYQQIVQGNGQPKKEKSN
ncbi:TPA: hypothetical protein U1V47_002009 [Streptococcus suis]|nr:hypothetical protein [Streptococcus suis]HEM3972329.1 hypothetical protein [Streptococcus suis]HEM3976439.1 hypothetical protein [Streptococcus suis]HEM3984639.1 hypothetical protein [Streptococcus suis]HEM3986697.1 hypothetical protein [Streptococcus suis]